MPRIEAFEAKTPRQKFFQGYWFFKLIYGRGNTYLSIPIGLVGSYMMFSLWLKLYVGFNNQVFIYSLAALILGIILIVGYIDVRRQIIHEEMSFNNRYNPELQYIKEKLKENGK